jgi:hypothetical protein
MMGSGGSGIWCMTLLVVIMMEGGTCELRERGRKEERQDVKERQSSINQQQQTTVQYIILCTAQYEYSYW